MLSLLRSRLLLSISAAAVTAGVALAWSWHESSAVELRSAVPAPTAEDGQSSRSLGRLADTLRATSQKALTSCLGTHGFADLARVIDSPEDSQVEDLTKIRDSELGPTTMDDARSFGMLGLKLKYTRVPPPEIVLASAAFDSALNSCQTSARYQPAMALVGRTTDVLNKARSQVLNSFEQETRADAMNEITCVQEDYPALSRDTLLAGSLEKALQDAGVRVGSTREPERVTDTIDGVTIARYRTRRTYVPSAEEVRFAVTWARCDSRVGYSQRARQRMADAMSEWQEANSPTVSSLEKELLTLLDRTAP